MLAAGKDLEVCRHLQVSASTWHRWLSQCGGIEASDAMRRKELEGEYARLKKLLAEAELNKAIRREIEEETSDPGPQAHRRQGGQHRSTQRLPARVASDDEAQLRTFLREVSRARPRWGWRRAAKAARRAGRQVNDKRICRVWREQGLKVPQRTPKKRLAGIGTHVGAMCPIRDLTPSEFANTRTTNQPKAA